MDTKNYNTPGQYIKALLTERNWTQRLLAIILDFDETSLNQLINGKRDLSASMALKLGEAFNVPPDGFFDLQKKLELAKARLIAEEDPKRSTRAHLFKELPVQEMIKRGWLDVKDIRNVPQVELALSKFFNANSVDEIEVLPHAAKKTATFSPVTPAQMAWIYRVNQIAKGMMVQGRYSPSSVRNAIDQLNGLLLYPEEAQNVPRIMSECGIRFIVVETLTSAKIDGVCFWINDFTPVIGMTMRYDRIDNFWFVLRHEIEHVLRGHGRTSIMLDVELEGDRAGTGESISKEERIANEAAAEFCIPQKRLESFIARKSPIFRERDLIGLSNTLKIHPGLVTGQLQRKTGKYNLFRQYLVNIGNHVRANAVVDGWGDVAPIF